jgi:hypothetical protein
VEQVVLSILGALQYPEKVQITLAHPPLPERDAADPAKSAGP